MADGSGAATPESTSKAPLSYLLGRFDRDPEGSRRLIRQLLEQDTEEFYRAAIESLQVPDDSPGTRCLVTTLLRNNLILRALLDPALSPAQAQAVLRLAAEADPNSACCLARTLSEEEFWTMSGTKALMRLMDIFAEACDASRILPFVRFLIRHPDAHVRSKAVLLIGGSENAKWLQSRLSDSDPRIRANAVEAIGEAEGEVIEAVLLVAAQDDDNRVAANALVALYHRGYSEAADELRTMSQHESPRFRASAAWAMGATRDPQFVSALAHMIGGSDPAVRRRAFAALRRIRHSMQDRKVESWSSPADLAARRESLAADLPAWERALLRPRSGRNRKTAAANSASSAPAEPESEPARR